MCLSLADTLKQLKKKCKVKQLRSDEPQGYYRCLLKGIVCKPGLGAKAYAEMLGGTDASDIADAAGELALPEPLDALDDGSDENKDVLVSVVIGNIKGMLCCRSRRSTNPQSDELDQCWACDMMHVRCGGEVRGPSDTCM